VLAVTCGNAIATRRSGDLLFVLEEELQVDLEHGLEQTLLGHPYALGGLAALGLGHDGEGGAEEVVEQGGLAGGLGAKDGDEVVVEASVGDVGDLEVVVELVAEVQAARSAREEARHRRKKTVTQSCTAHGCLKVLVVIYVLELLVLVNDLDAMLVIGRPRRVAHGREVAVHCRDAVMSVWELWKRLKQKKQVGGGDGGKRRERAELTASTSRGSGADVKGARCADV
jgi:hypothetical protein